MDYETIKAKLAKLDQDHILQFWNQLHNEEKEQFLKQLNTLQFENINNLFNAALESAHSSTSLKDDRMEPIPPSKFEAEESCSIEVLENYRNLGLQEIADGNVAVVLMAGGQGTRLGVTYPKGMYSVGLPSKKTLFQLQAERIKRLQHLAEAKTKSPGKIPWYIMTSGPTHKATENFFKENDYFGLKQEDVVFFKQGLLPCFDFDGKLLLETKYSVALSPDGNGGIYKALAQNGLLQDMTQRGIKCVHVHSVDNILVKVADPVFIGYCIAKNADCGVKVVRKAEPSEAVGVVCLVDGKFQVVEYSEISDKLASLRDQKGNLVFSAGNICNHFFTVGLLKDLAEKYDSKLKLHVAKKKIVHVNSDGEFVKPARPSGIKIEKFIFDALPFSRNFVTWEVPRISEFSAMKNANDAGTDSPATAKRDLLALHKSYIEKAGGVIQGDAEVEISPLLSYDGENLETVKGKVYSSDRVLDS